MSEIRCLCLDVDGVLTDGRLFVDDVGRGARRFHVHDGFAIQWYQRLGGTVIICSGKRSEAVGFRAAELGIKHVILGSGDKVADVSPLLDRLGFTLEQLAMIGDDLPDLPLMRRCGRSIAVANAVDEVKAAADVVTVRSGGHGAVREAIEHLMNASGHWAQVVEHYSNTAPGQE